MFRFANPQYLWLLAALPVLAALFWLAMRNRRRRLLARRLKLSAKRTDEGNVIVAARLRVEAGRSPLIRPRSEPRPPSPIGEGT